MGAVGAWAARRGWTPVAAIAAVSIALEPLAVYLAYLGSHGYFAAGDGEWNAVYAGEGVAGTLAVALLCARVIRRGPRQQPR